MLQGTSFNGRGSGAAGICDYLRLSKHKNPSLVHVSRKERTLEPAAICGRVAPTADTRRLTHECSTKSAGFTEPARRRWDGPHGKEAPHCGGSRANPQMFAAIGQIQAAAHFLYASGKDGERREERPASHCTLNPRRAVACVSVRHNKERER
ncbi:hypothetical protein MTO96_015633 [Rhipicephalus appendiculatus]